MGSADSSYRIELFQLCDIIKVNIVQIAADIVRRTALCVDRYRRPGDIQGFREAGWPIYSRQCDVNVERKLTQIDVGRTVRINMKDIFVTGNRYIGSSFVLCGGNLSGRTGARSNRRYRP